MEVFDKWNCIKWCNYGNEADDQAQHPQITRIEKVGSNHECIQQNFKNRLYFLTTFIIYFMLNINSFITIFKPYS